MQKQRFYAPNNVIEPYQYDIAQNYIEVYQPSTEINDLIETYLILKLIKRENEISNFKISKRYIHEFPN